MFHTEEHFQTRHAENGESCVRNQRRISAYTLRGIALLTSAVGWAVIAIAHFQVARMCVTDRSFQVDEARLAENVVVRSFSTLLASPLTGEQAAPAGYLIVQKAAVTMLGAKEFSLRLSSTISFSLATLVILLLAKKAFRLEAPVLPAALFASSPFLIAYAGEAKQYMPEAFVCSLVLLLYCRFASAVVRSRRAAAILAAAFSAAVWFANPACFVIGGVVLCEVLASIFRRGGPDYRRFWHFAFIGACAVISFVAAWFLWNRYGNSPYMQQFWADYAFRPIHPFSASTIGHNAQLLRLAFDTIGLSGTACSMAIALLIVGIIRTVIRRNRAGVAIVLMIALALCASSLHMFPLADRLWLFAAPLVSILIVYGADGLVSIGAHGVNRICRAFPENVVRTLCTAAFAVALAMVRVDTLFPSPPSRALHYHSGEETNALVRHVREHIRPGEKVFVYRSAAPGVRFAIGYGNNRIGNVAEDNVIWSAGFAYTPEYLSQDLPRIKEAGRCWLITSHIVPRGLRRRWAPLEKALKDIGHLEQVFVFEDTRLYYFTANVPPDTVNEAPEN